MIPHQPSEYGRYLSDTPYRPSIYGQYLSDTPFQVQPSLTPIHTNPLTAGVQLGMLGAVAGIGVAGVQRAIRLRTAGTTPPNVMRSMLVGSLIGAGLGVAGSFAAKPEPRPIKSWYDLSDKINNDLYGTPLHKRGSYSGLLHVTDGSLEKQAIPLALPLIGKGLLAAMAAAGLYDAAKHGGKAIGAATKGSGKAALGHAGRAALGGVWALAGAGPVGGAVKALALGGRLARGGGRSIKTVKNTVPLWRRIPGIRGRVAQTLTAPPGWSRQLAQSGINRVAGSSLGQRIAADPALQRRLFAAGSRMQGIDKRMGKIYLPAMAAEVAMGVGVPARPVIKPRRAVQSQPPLFTRLFGNRPALPQIVAPVL
jgi:hypothetical protein